MENTRSDRRGGFRGRSGGSQFGGRGGGGFGGRPGGRSSGGFSEREGGFRGRDSGRYERSERRPLEMHNATCAKCGKPCQVPFRPTGDKPVYCSDCFRKNEGPSSRSNFGSRNIYRPQSGISSEQFNQINEKLDKIMKFLKIK